MKHATPHALDQPLLAKLRHQNASQVLSDLISWQPVDAGVEDHSNGGST
jgi:hypothetical protein